MVWSPCSPRDSQESSPTPQFKSINSLAFSLFYGPTLTSIHDYWKNHSFGSVDLPAKRCLCLLIHCLGIKIVFQGASKKQASLVSWLLSQSSVILEPKKIKSVTVYPVSPSICHEVMEPDDMILFFERWALSQLFHSALSLSSRGSLVPIRFLLYGWCHLLIWAYWYVSW